MPLLMRWLRGEGRGEGAEGGKNKAAFGLLDYASLSSEKFPQGRR